MMKQQRPTRRDVLGTITAGAAALACGACRSQPEAQTTAAKEEKMQDKAPEKMPAVFLPHGGGPWPFISPEKVMGGPGTWDQMDHYMRQTLRMTPVARPSAVLLVSAHWEEAVPTVMTSQKPPMLYDYYGFPPESYEVQWPSPGAPEVALHVRELLEEAGIRSAQDDSRGFDHGTFVPMKLAWPQADMPTFQLSLKRGLDPETHFKIGQAIAPLREQGVFIVGSGMSYHNLRSLLGSMRSKHVAQQVARESQTFDAWLNEAMLQDPSRRQQALIEWERAPQARACHPREEHLLPLMVVAGAAAEDQASLPYRDQVLGAYVSAVHFA
jgi:aromatic ring-opening dioxygenase catalytic subunit (LigB family)